MTPEVSRLIDALDRFREVFEQHSDACGGGVAGVALSPSDHEELGIQEVWGIPILAWDDVERGRCRLLCETCGILIPDIRTVEDLLDRWQYQL